MFAFSLRQLFDDLYQSPLWLSLVVPVLGLLGVLHLSWQGQLYDFPVLALFTLAYDAMVRRRWGLYLAAFTAASFCKETSLFLPMIFVLWLFRDTELARRRFWQLLTAQLGIFGLTRLLLMVMYASNPGGAVEFNLPGNLFFYSAHVHLIRVLIMSMVFLFFLLAILYRFRQQPLFLRRAILIAAPLVVLFLVFGAPFEVRVFYEVYPIALLMTIYPLARRFDRRLIVRTA